MSGVCTMEICQAPLCNDNVTNGNETGKDCGGETCSKCPDTWTCILNADCISGVCLMGTCQ
ncbi:unnamed protein product, partial [Rotaria sordida]